MNKNIKTQKEVQDFKNMMDEVLQKNKYQMGNDAVPIIKPKELMEYLNKFIIGQEEAKKALCLAVYHHYAKIYLKPAGANLGKSNVLLVGPSGSGKTFLAQTIAKILDVPFTIADATSLTQAGYVGDDVENILRMLIENANGNVCKAEKGIVFIDEIDKIAKVGTGTSIARDVSGEGVQQALLKIIEGTIASVPPQGGRKHPQEECISIDTSNILFICSGAFVGLDEIIKKRTNATGMGFYHQETIKKDDCSLQQPTPDDLIKFGLIPEFVGRLPIITKLNPLTEDDIARIITDVEDSIYKQYKILFHFDNANLIIEKEAVKAIARKAIKNNTGARGARAIFENLLKDVMLEIPSMENSYKEISINEKLEVTLVKKPLLKIPTNLDSGDYKNCDSFFDRKIVI